MQSRRGEPCPPPLGAVRMKDRRDLWEESYRRRENFLFYPNEEVIRFAARHVRRRVGLDAFADVDPTVRKILDLGCGVGRHMAFIHEMGLHPWGIDLSAEAVAVARGWLSARGLAEADSRAVQGDVRHLPWEDDHFDAVLSHAVLDSMPFDFAAQAVGECARVLRADGLFYCDLISGDETGRSPDFADEVVVDKSHERGTIQSYFDPAKIERLLQPHFTLQSSTLVRHIDGASGRHRGRWHVVSRRA